MSIDFIFLCILVIAVIKGIRRGLIIAVFSLIGLVIGIIAGLQLSGVVAELLKSNYTTLGFWTPAIAFLLVFIATLLLIRFVAKLIESAIAVASLGWMNKAAGGILYGVMVTLSFSVFLFFGKQLHLIGQQTIEASFTYAFVEPWGPKTIEAFSVLFPSLKQLFSEIELFFKELSEKMQHSPNR